MAEGDQTLRDAWEQFCDGVRDAGRLIYDGDAPDDPQLRAEGMRHLARHVAWGIDHGFDPATTDAPFLARALGPTRKMGGDNPDSLYAGTPIDGRGTYRITGTLGSAHMVVFTVTRGRAALEAGLPGFVTNLHGRDIDVDADGRFELIVSSTEHAGNWLEITEDSERLVIRQAAGDWSTEDVGRMTIERLDSAPSRPAPLTASDVASGLVAATDWLSMTRRFAGYCDDGEHDANIFYFDPQSAKIQGAPGGEAYLCHYRLEPGEALVITVTPPPCWYWNIQIGNYWMESHDYRHHLASINLSQADLAEDGTVEIVVAHSDPHVPNWLDTAGNRIGHLAWRWIDAESLPTPQTRVVDLHDWMVSLSPDRDRTSTPERQSQIAARRRAVDRRYVP